MFNIKLIAVVIIIVLLLTAYLRTSYVFWYSNREMSQSEVGKEFLHQLWRSPLSFLHFLAGVPMFVLISVYFGGGMLVYSLLNYRRFASDTDNGTLCPRCQKPGLQHKQVPYTHWDAPMPMLYRCLSCGARYIRHEGYAWSEVPDDVRDEVPYDPSYNSANGEFIRVKFLYIKYFNDPTGWETVSNNRRNRRR